MFTPIIAQSPSTQDMYSESLSCIYYLNEKDRYEVKNGVEDDLLLKVKVLNFTFKLLLEHLPNITKKQAQAILDKLGVENLEILCNGPEEKFKNKLLANEAKKSVRLARKIVVKLVSLIEDVDIDNPSKIQDYCLNSEAEQILQESTSDDWVMGNQELEKMFE